MKRNVILSAVAATVVTGVLMMSGCGSNGPKAKDQSYSDVGTVNVVVAQDGSVDSKVTSSGTVKTTITLKTVRDCVDTNGATTPCTEVCTTAAPCEVKVESVCGPNAKLNYANSTDYTGVFEEWRDSNDANVVAERADAGTIAAFSGSVNVSQTGGIVSCDFDFDTFIVCALTEGKKLPYYNTSDNSTGYVMVLVEYADGTKEWKKVDITRKSNGEENDQPFIEITGLSGKMPVKFSVISVLKVGSPATGSSGSTGTIGAGD